MTRQDPKKHAAGLRKALDEAEAELGGEQVVPAMMPPGSDDFRSIFSALRTFRVKFGIEAAAEHEAQIGKMLNATKDEIEEGISKIKSRNHWNKEPELSRPPARERNAKVPIRKTVDDPPPRSQPVGPAGAPRISKNPAFQQSTPVPQGPNAARATEAMERAASKIIEQAKALLKKAAEKSGS
jgi:hypothetical protein